jgi:hypothetical protein
LNFFHDASSSCAALLEPLSIRWFDFFSLLLFFQLRTNIPDQLLQLTWKLKRQILTAEALSG